MRREYLEEDLVLIRKYFPGARPVTLRTPFDLTVPNDPWRVRADSFRDDQATGWQRGLLWSRR